MPPLDPDAYPPDDPFPALLSGYRQVSGAYHLPSYVQALLTSVTDAVEEAYAERHADELPEDWHEQGRPLWTIVRPLALGEITLRPYDWNHEAWDEATSPPTPRPIPPQFVFRGVSIWLDEHDRLGKETNVVYTPEQWVRWYYEVMDYIERQRDDYQEGQPWNYDQEAQRVLNPTGRSA